jgi:hypothetical protein
MAGKNGRQSSIHVKLDALPEGSGSLSSSLYSCCCARRRAQLRFTLKALANLRK